MSSVEKKRILVCDSQNFLFKILNKKFGDEFYIQRSKYYLPVGKYCESHILIYVIYNERELNWFKRIFRRGKSILVCVFNKNVFQNLSQLQNGYDFFLINGSQQIRSGIASEVEGFLSFTAGANREFELGKFLFHKYDFEFYDSEI